MQKYFRYFRVTFIITVIIVIACFVVTIVMNEPVERNNTKTDLTYSVFDYADNLTAEQERMLEEYICEIEEKVQVDIAVVTLNESLENAGYDDDRDQMWVRGYAEAFADDHEMGYDFPRGANIVFVDNIYREPSTGRVDSWLSTSGKAKNSMSTIDCEELLDKALVNLNDFSSSEDYYKAYRKVVKLIPRYMSSASGVMVAFEPIVIIIAAFLIAGVYILINGKSIAGKKTTSAQTYLKQGKPNMITERDVFRNKHVTKVRIQSSSGGGGGHGGGGGGGHGGGGHSR